MKSWHTLTVVMVHYRTREIGSCFNYIWKLISDNQTPWLPLHNFVISFLKGKTINTYKRQEINIFIYTNFENNWNKLLWNWWYHDHVLLETGSRQQVWQWIYPWTGGLQYTEVRGYLSLSSPEPPQTCLSILS